MEFLLGHGAYGSVTTEEHDGHMHLNVTQRRAKARAAARGGDKAQAARDLPTMSKEDTVYGIANVTKVAGVDKAEADVDAKLRRDPAAKHGGAATVWAKAGTTTDGKPSVDT